MYPWNKGLKTGKLAKTHREKISAGLKLAYANGREGFKKGVPAWNKGLTGRKPYMNLDGLELGHREGIGHHLWKGEMAGYTAKHSWVTRHNGKAKKCELCGSIKKCVWANISGEYRRDKNDYISLCYPCHYLFDKDRMGQAKPYYQNSGVHL